LLNTPEERWSHLHRIGSLKSRSVSDLSVSLDIDLGTVLAEEEEEEEK